MEEKTMDIKKLQRILRITTEEFRKGELVSEENHNGVKVINFYNMPHQSKASKRLEMIDCHFFMIGVDKTKAEICKEVLKNILVNYPQFDRFANGLSYIEVGAEIRAEIGAEIVNASESQEMALMLFALGKVLDLWDIITPKTLGFKEKIAADELANQGLLMISGYKG